MFDQFNLLEAAANLFRSSFFWLWSPTAMVNVDGQRRVKFPNENYVFFTFLPLENFGIMLESGRQTAKTSQNLNKIHKMTQC